MALIHIGFFSQALGMCVSCDVILPQQATKLIGMQSNGREGKLPVLWLLHGASDNHTIWQRRTSIERYAAPLGLAVVMPNGHLSSYTDMAHGGKYYTYISQELPEVMRTYFNFSEKREDNFIAGLSMGGYGCMKIGLANPDKYAAIGCLSAGVRRLESDPNALDERVKERYMRTYGDRDLIGTEEDTFGQADAIIREGKPVPRIYHSCGDNDFLLESAHFTRDYFRSIPGNPFDYVYEEDPGAHTWEYWDEHIQRFLKYIDIAPIDDIRN